MARVVDRRGGRALLIASGVSFALLAAIAAFAEPLLLRLDRPIQRWVISVRQAWLNETMRWITLLGTRYVIGALLLALAAWVLARGRCRVVLMVMVIAFALNPAVEWALKALVDRPRPDLLLLARARGPSFPSGHVVASIGFYAMLPLLVWDATTSSRLRRAAASIAAAIVVAVGFSRVYLGVHWFTDVVGGLLAGTVVVVATYRVLGGHRLDRSRACCPLGPEVGHRSRSPSILAR
ncbi:MAG: phosphatase PAP2 family protein [Actinobacteria bacterium]|nr:phosphatase PAP2 family protein [Actinomycetota bacterium]